MTEVTTVPQGRWCGFVGLKSSRSTGRLELSDTKLLSSADLGLNRISMERTMPTAQRIAVMQAELDARLSALEGGESWDRHAHHIKWLAAAVWQLEHPSGGGVLPIA
jgi:hypothetical protein